MLNNLVKKIKIATSGHKRNAFNFGHDTNTTFGFGEVQPLQCLYLVPNSKTTCSSESLVRLAPVVAPAFARIKYKIYHQFVGMSELSRNFSSLLSQSSVNRGNGVFVPEQVPHTTMSLLTAACLRGARATLYRVDTSDGGLHNTFTTYHKTDSRAATALQSLTSNNILSAGYTAYGYSCFALNLKKLQDMNVLDFGLTGSAPIGLANASDDSFFDTGSTAVPFVSIESADLVLDNIVVDGVSYSLAFRLSDFGLRLRKVLIGLGYQLDLTNSEKVSIMPLLACYKAYFDIFGLTLYTNYETTHCARLLSEYDYSNKVFWQNLDASFNGLMKFLSKMWYTSEQDFVSSHVPNTAISPKLGLSSNLIDVSSASMSTPIITEVDSSTGEETTFGNGHAYLNSIIHGHLDEQYLKKLYKWTNRNTIAGKKIAEVLKAQGLGKFVDNTKPNFIGYTDQSITIQDVYATSDTFKSDSSGQSGARLGEYAGKGLSYDKSKSFTYDNDEYGYWITFGVIVPDAGYSQALDSRVMAISKNDFYQPEFDGLGMEASRKSIVCGATNFSSGGHMASQTFGFVPRYSSWKIGHNVNNGDFSLRSTRNSYLPYTLDKYIPVSEQLVYATSESGRAFQTALALSSADIPNASTVYRYPTRYPWLGNFNRIFVNDGAQNFVSSDTASNYSKWEYTVRNDDNFLSHNVFNVICYAPMKKIEESFETDEDGYTNAEVKKA